MTAGPAAPSASRHASLGALGGGFCGWWQCGVFPAAARCGAPPIPLPTRPRLFSQLQHYGTLRGADEITDHGAEYVVITQTIPTTMFQHRDNGSCARKAA